MVDTKSEEFRQEVVDITPEMAAEFLRLNSNNRKAREYVVRQYAQLMSEGRWSLSHQGIAFYKDGSLADGQHRLLAVVRSGTTVRMLVSYGVERTSYIDVGLKRTGADCMRIYDPELSWVNKNHVAWANLLNSEFPAIGCGGDIGKTGDYLKRYRHSYEWVAKNYSPRNEPGLRTAGVYAAFVSAHIAGANVEKLAQAAYYLTSGLINTDYDDPAVNTILALRTTLMNGTLQKGRMPGKRMQRDIMLCTGQALKNYINGTKKSKCEVPPTFAFPVYGMDGTIVFNPAS